MSTHTATQPDTTASVGGHWALAPVPFPALPGVCQPAEQTTTPGLVIVPEVSTRWGRFTGRWRLTHTGSGLSVVSGAATTLAYAREAARLLASDTVDWTATEATIRSNPHAKTLCRHARLAVDEAQQTGRPLWWARRSWQHLAPAWVLDYTYDAALFDTFEQLVGWVSTHPHGFERCEVTRAEHPTWRLLCAAPLCDPPAVLTIPDPHEDDLGVEPRELDRGTTATIACGEGWTRYDHQHWLCPTCTTDHTTPDTTRGAA
jgi:hypothetical protein